MHTIKDQSPFHDSATLYVTGAAHFTDDLIFPADGVHIALGLSERAHAEIISMDLSAAEAVQGVVCTLTAADIPGCNDASPVFGDDPVFARDIVSYHGQCIFAVVADSAKAARTAAQKAQIVYKDRPAILTIQQALSDNSLLCPPRIMKRGNVQDALAAAPHRLQGSLTVGGQEHFYLEGQAALALPGEGDEMLLHVSTQHPSEVQHKVAGALGTAFNSITVQVRRMGGGFGGKESQANLPAIIAAVAARKTGRAAKLVYDRDEDMRVTGKRHDFLITYEAGFDDQGRILALDVTQALRCGMSFDLSSAIADRAMMHAENAYYIPDIQVTAYLCRTNTPSNTAFRGFGGPQGIIGMERIVDDVASALGLDPLTVRQRNFYADKDSADAGQLTPYRQPVKDGIINALVDELVRMSDYRERRKQIEAGNQDNPPLRRGIALTPVKFGISFNKTMLNQAGALVHIYTDGSVHLNHGGTEMGQGLNIKVAQICADAFGLPVGQIKITATNTGKVPNTSATAASSGSDLNGMATARAAQELKQRISACLAGLYQDDPAKVRFQDGYVHIGPEALSFAQAASLCWQQRVSLSATGFYATPDIHWDAERFEGSPFYYFAYGAAVSEVVIDSLTGESRLVRADILHDVGNTINPAIDRGQIEGGFIQGMGWLTSEEIVYASTGKLLTHAPSTYKIPACSDRPGELNIALYNSGGNPAETIHRSKAVGEPPFMLAVSVHNALAHALCGLTGGRPVLNAPATPETILMAASSVIQPGQHS